MKRATLAALVLACSAQAWAQDKQPMHTPKPPIYEYVQEEPRNLRLLEDNLEMDTTQKELEDFSDYLVLTQQPAPKVSVDARLGFARIRGYTFDSVGMNMGVSGYYLQIKAHIEAGSRKEHDDFDFSVIKAEGERKYQIVQLVLSMGINVYEFHRSWLEVNGSLQVNVAIDTEQSDLDIEGEKDIPRSFELDAPLGFGWRSDIKYPLKHLTRGMVGWLNSSYIGISVEANVFGRSVELESVEEGHYYGLYGISLIFGGTKGL